MPLPDRGYVAQADDGFAHLSSAALAQAACRPVKPGIGLTQPRCGFLSSKTRIRADVLDRMVNG